jgi:hypothetical protein
MRTSARDALLVRHGLSPGTIPTVSIQKLPASGPFIALTRDGLGPLLLTIEAAQEFADQLGKAGETELAGRLHAAIERARTAS